MSLNLHEKYSKLITRNLNLSYMVCKFTRLYNEITICVIIGLYIWSRTYLTDLFNDIWTYEFPIGLNLVTVLQYLT